MVQLIEEEEVELMETEKNKDGGNVRFLTFILALY